jgi:hypothetical protein
VATIKMDVPGQPGCVMGAGDKRMRRVKPFEPGMPARDYLIASLGGIALLGLICAALLVTA